MTRARLSASVWALALAWVVLLVACGPARRVAVAPGPSPTSPASAPAPTPSLPPGAFENPVYDHDFPDPFVLEANGTYYAYATNSGGVNVQTLSSRDLVHWHTVGDAMPSLPPWALPGDTWAPEVLRQPDGKYALYFTAASLELSVQCVGTATSSSPTGPFTSNASRPLVCQTGQGGSIDPSPFRDRDGRLYLYWKNDGNCCGMPTYIYVQRLSANGLRLIGQRRRIETADAPWEGSLVEAPEMLEHGRDYYLFYSANDYASEQYAVGYARCKGPTGPCRDAPENPVLHSGCDAAGPGHNSFARDPRGRLWIVYHAWPPDAIGSIEPGRVLWIDRISWRGTRPVVHGPTCGPQPMP